MDLSPRTPGADADGGATVETAAAPSAGSPRLKITEVFTSLQGETRFTGWPTTFIRLTGCPLRCGYCDTTYSFHGGAWRTVESLVEDARARGVRHVCVTGGEPLVQKNCLPLLVQLCDAGFVVSLETSGALAIHGVDARVARIVDLKTPGSGEVHRNHWPNVEAFKHGDEVKFVLCSRADYDWAVEKLREHALHERCEVLFSPVHGTLDPRALADWIVADRLPVRFQMQLHKQLWGNESGR